MPLEATVTAFVIVDFPFDDETTAIYPVGFADGPRQH